MPGVSPVKRGALERPSTLHQVPWSNRDVGAPWRNVKAAPWRRSRDLRRSKSPPWLRGIVLEWDERTPWKRWRQNWWEFSKIFVCIFFGTAISSLPEGTWKKLNFNKTDCFWNDLKDLGPYLTKWFKNSLPYQSRFNLPQGLNGNEIDNAY